MNYLIFLCLWLVASQDDWFNILDELDIEEQYIMPSLRNRGGLLLSITGVSESTSATNSASYSPSATNSATSSVSVSASNSITPSVSQSISCIPHPANENNNGKGSGKNNGGKGGGKSGGGNQLPFCDTPSKSPSVSPSVNITLIVENLQKTNNSNIGGVVGAIVGSSALVSIVLYFIYRRFGIDTDSVELDDNEEPEGETGRYIEPEDGIEIERILIEI